MNKKQRIVIIIAAIALILTIFGITYAYFTANIIGSESTSTISVKGAKLQINYQDNSGKGNSIFSGDNNTNNFKLKELEVFKLLN